MGEVLWLFGSLRVVERRATARLEGIALMPGAIRMPSVRNLSRQSIISQKAHLGLAILITSRAWGQRHARHYSPEVQLKILTQYKWNIAQVRWVYFERAFLEAN